MCDDIFNPDAELPLPPDPDLQCAALAIAQWELAKLQALSDGCDCQEKENCEERVLCIVAVYDRLWEQMREIVANYHQCAGTAGN